MTYTLWTKEEETELARMVEISSPLNQIAEKIGRSPESVKQKIKREGFDYWDKNWRKKLRFTTDSYIGKFKAVHGDLYDYSEFTYKGADKKYPIICRTHGRFKQSAINHSLGFGCPRCANDKFRLDTMEFIKRAKAIHGNKYDYTKSKYSDYQTDLIIGCPVHGDFKQKAGVHLAGHGCRQCRDDIERLTTSEFIRRSIEIHGDKYDYSRTKYVRSSKKVNIICKEHGEFHQTPNKHLKGQGCDRCGGSSQKTTKEFIRRAKEVHGNRYDYSKVTYYRSHCKVVILCKKHGEFQQTPASHLYGKGCPSCCSSVGEASVEKWLIGRKIKFRRQKKFDQCRDKRRLPFDFYLPKCNTCIEYNGIQHYRPTAFFGNKLRQTDCAKHDQIKKGFCKKMGIKLLIIKYSENTEEALSRSLREKDDQNFLKKYDASIYPKPSVTVDIIICTIMYEQLRVLLIKRKHPPYRDCWAIPGGFVDIEKNETLERAAARELQKETGLKNIYIEQLKTYGDPDRDPRTRVITVAYFALVPECLLRHQKIKAADDAKEAGWFKLWDLPKSLAFDHSRILHDVYKRLRGKILYAPIAFEFVPKAFTWSQLLSVYEAVLGEEFPNFRRKMKLMYHIVAVKNKKRAPESGLGRPGALLEYKGMKDIL